MAEVQNTEQSGETVQQFIEFVMMQAQQAAFYLGQIPNPQTGQAEVHLDAAKIFIDQLTMIRSKTRGNLTSEEMGVLNNAISNLQMVFVETSQAGKTSASASEKLEEKSADEAPKIATSDAPAAEKSAGEVEGESKKKFSKSYGA